MLNVYHELTSNSTGWLLILESDAMPYRPKHFDSAVRLLSTYTTYDVIWLDYRNLPVGFSPFADYVGTNGMMYKSSSLGKIAKELKYSDEYCKQSPFWFASDMNLRFACNNGKLKCTQVPLILEFPFKSTLDERNLGDRLGTSPGVFIVLLCVSSMILFFLRFITS